MIYFIFAVFFLTLNGLDIFEKNSMIRILPNIFLILGIVNYAFFKKGHLFIGGKHKNFDLLIYLGLLGFFFLSVIRTNAPYATTSGIANDAATLILINVFIYLGASYQLREYNSLPQAASRITAGVIFGPSILVLFMLMLFIVAYKSGTLIEGEGRSRAVILGFFGIVTEKRNIPYVGYHPNFIGIFAGAIFVMSVLSLTLAQSNSRIRKLLYINIIICLAFMVLADSRVTFVNSFISLGLIYFLKKIRSLGLLKILVLAMPILPLLMLTLLMFLSEFDVIQSMSRNPQDLTTGNYRSYIWVHCYNDLLHPRPAHLFGFGEHGQFGSGVSSKYAYIFVNNPNPLLSVTHNAFLQSFFDVGYFGSAFFLMVLFLAVDRSVKMYREGLGVGVVYLGFFVYFLLSGTTESNFGYYNRTYFLVFMMAATALFVIYNEFLRTETKHLKPIKGSPNKD